MQRIYRMIAVSLVVGMITVGCSHSRGLHSAQERKMTVGVVQKEIRVGMEQAAVAAALGSPNIVTRNNAGSESWIYDKIATEASYSNSSSDVAAQASAAGMAGDVLLLGTIAGGHGRNKGASATTQKTLTVIITFDQTGLVESFSYHTSTF